MGRRWAKLGTRPVAVLDQRTASTYIFGAICPLHGKAVGLILPECNIEAMNLHLAEIAAAVAPGAHAALVLDQAGWHVSDKLIVPPNITLVPLPPKCPELNPIENIWQYMRANWLSDRIFETYDDIVDHCSDAWNKLVARPWAIMSIGYAIGQMRLDQREVVLCQIVCQRISRSAPPWISRNRSNHSSTSCTTSAASLGAKARRSRV